MTSVGIVPPAGPAADPSPDAPPAVARTERWERRALAVALVVYGLVQLNAIVHHGTWGQDFGNHLGVIAQAWRDPWGLIRTYRPGQNNPPLFYLIVAGVYGLTGHVHSLEVFSALTAALNAGAVVLLHRLSLRVIAQPALRLAMAVFLLFLPVGMIHSVVLAADAIATPTVVFLTYALVRLAEAGHGSIRPFLGWTLALAAALAIAVWTKFTAVALLPAAGVVVLAMWRGRLVGPGRAALAVAIGILPAAYLGVATYWQFRAQQTYNLGIDFKADPHEGEINVRSLLFPRAGDVELLKAPPYSATLPARPGESPFMQLHQKHRYSYWGLLHLGVFTDVLNVYQHDPKDAYVGPRSPTNQRRMALAVRTALPFAAVTIVAVPVMLLASAYRVLVRRDGRAFPVLAVLTIAFAFFLVIVLFLPYAYALGGAYWAPRLVVPSLFGFFFVAYVAAGRTPLGRARAGASICLAAAVAQSALHVSFLRPWGENGPPALPLHVIAPPTDLAVRAELDVRFPAARPAAGTYEPLLVTGHPGTSNLIFVTYLDDRHVRVTFNRWGDAAMPQSDPIPVDPGQTYRIRLELDVRAGRVRVWWDGREVLDVRNDHLAGGHRRDVKIGHNSPGGPVAERFSGELTKRSVQIEGGRDRR